MLTHQALLLVDHVTALQAAGGGIGGAFKTAGKAILGFLAAIFVVGALIGLLFGFFIGRAVGRKQGSPASSPDLAHDPS